MPLDVNVRDVEGMAPHQLRKIINFLADYAQLDAKPLETNEARVDLGTLTVTMPPPASAFEAAGRAMTEIFATGDPQPGESSGGAIAPPPPSAPEGAGVTTPPPPPAPAAEGTGTPAAPVVDSEGLPWDHRIHTETKSQNKNGTWRIKRNTPDELVASVKAELRVAMGAAPVPAGNEPPIPPIPPGGLSIAEAKAWAASQNAAASAPPPPAPPAPVAEGTAAPAPYSFDWWLMPRITALIGDGQITAADISAAVVSVGLPALPMLKNRPDLIPQVAASLGITE